MVISTLDAPLPPFTTAPPTRGAAAPRKARRTLPAFLTQRLGLLWIATIPQGILLLLNLRAYHLISGEMNAEQGATAFGIFALEICLLLVGTVPALVPLRTDKGYPWLLNAPLF